MPLRKVTEKPKGKYVTRGEYDFVHPTGPATEIWYEGASQVFTDEEIAESDKKFLASQEAALPAILAAGFIRYPIFTHNREGELVEMDSWLHPAFEPSCSEGFFEKHGMTSNIYIPSYKRAGTAGTMKMLDSYGVKNYYICIDPDQFEDYRKHYPLEKLVIRDVNFRRTDILEPHSSLKRPMNMAGHAPLCNFTVALSRSLGESIFTFADDDFVGMAMKANKGDKIMQAGEVYNKDNFYRCSKLLPEYGFDFQKFWHRLEELTEHTRNPGFVGLEKFGTVFALPICFKFGTRVYSFYVTKNKTQIRHEGWQNNDVLTSIYFSKRGMVNLLSEGICYNSEPTQKGSGGQAGLYAKLGTMEKGKILVRATPNITKIINRYSRIHHSGQYTVYTGLRPVGEPLPREE